MTVVGAVIVQGGKVLAALRGREMTAAGMWEFPGGKVETGETHVAALAREVKEELGCEIAVGGYITTTTHAQASGTISLSTYYAHVTSGAPRAAEHEAIAWLAPGQLLTVRWAPADIPAVRRVMSAFART